MYLAALDNGECLAQRLHAVEYACRCRTCNLDAVGCHVHGVSLGIIADFTGLQCDCVLALYVCDSQLKGCLLFDEFGKELGITLHLGISLVYDGCGAVQCESVGLHFNNLLWKRHDMVIGCRLLPVAA